MSKQQVRVGDHVLAVSNLDKVLYPESNTTKADVLGYYVRVSEVLLPHLADRPVTFKRFPDGAHTDGFFQKRCPDHRPEWLDTLTLGEAGRDRVVEHCNIVDASGLAWAANLAALELHVPLARAPNTSRPDQVVFDLDPGPGTDVVDCAAVALQIHALMEQLGLACWVKTSGSKGLQVYVPIKPSSYERTRAFAETVARGLESRFPQQVVSVQKRTARKDKVLIDWYQNHRTKTTVCAYSLRARPRPTVSTPVTWAEVEHAAAKHDRHALIFEIDDVLARIETHGDLFAPVATERQELPALRPS